jgi:hypothetical protein
VANVTANTLRPAASGSDSVVGESRQVQTSVVAIAYRCDARVRCTFIVWDGDVTPQQWNRHVERMLGDPAFPPGPLMLADLTTARGAPSITPDVIAEMAGRWSAHAEELGQMRWALVPNEAWDKARRFETELDASGIHTMVFNEPWSACAWLGLDSDVARSILTELREELRA